MTNPALLAARYAGRPILMRADEAQEYALQIRRLDPRALSRRTGPLAFLRRAVQIDRRAEVDVEDVDRTPAAYCPRWLEARGGPDFESELGWTLKDGVALFCVDTPLVEHGFHFCGEWYHGYDTISAAFAEMRADPRVRGVHWRLRTPGGVAGEGLPKLAAELRALRDGGFPIWAHCAMAASAGYWLASACQRINASPLGLVGSIGAVLLHEDWSKALEKEGVAVTPIQFGGKKTDGSWFKPLSEAALADLQSEIDELGAMFVADVVAGRPNLTEEAVLATEAACFLARNRDASRSGLALGLVDEVIDEDAAFAALVAAVADPQTPAASAAASKETDMKRSAVKAAMTKAGLTAAQMARVEAELPEDEDAEDAPAAYGEETDPEDEAPAAAESGAEPAPDEGEEDGAETVDAKVARAVLALPEAKGREALAQQLAFEPGMTVAKAKSFLSAAGKSSTLGGRMTDPNLSAYGGGQSAQDAGAMLVADAKERAAARSGR